MKILIIVQIFEGLSDTGSDRHYFFAKKMAEKGHEVCVITGNVDYKNAKKKFDSAKGVVKKNYGAVTVNYVPVFTSFRGSFFKRFLFFVSFFIAALWFVLKERGVDVVYAISTPLTVGLLGVLVSKFKKLPLIFEVTDVWPDAAVHTGVIQNPLIIFVAKLIEEICYSSSRKIICLTKGIASTIGEKGVNLEKIKLIPNGVDFDLFKNIEGCVRSEVRNEYGINGKFVLMYLGAHGAYNSLNTILFAAKILKNLDDIIFVFVGEGDEKAGLLQYVTNNGLSNVKFIGAVPRSVSVKILNAADGFLLPNRKGEFFRGNLPNKLFDYLASSKPVIVAGEGETADLVLDAKAGFVVTAENAEAMAEAIINLFQLGTLEQRQFGEAGRSYVEKFYNRSQHADLLVELIESSKKYN
jgi:glycosyltransferase involved in cell wall biosynthesis